MITQASLNLPADSFEQLVNAFSASENIKQIQRILTPVFFSPYESGKEINNQTYRQHT
jgi:hypothetical protein